MFLSNLASEVKTKIYKSNHTNHTSVIKMNNIKIKTVSMNERGVIVIPEEMREDLGLEGNTTLVLVENGKEIIVKKENDVIDKLTSDDDSVWKKLSEKSLQRAWEKEDDVWDKFVKK